MCTRTNDHAPVRRRPVPRVARSLRATPTPRAIPRRRRAIPRPRRSSPRRRAVGFARVGFARVARGRGIQASRASRARFARRARDSRFATDRRVVSRASTFARVEARVAVAVARRRARRRARRGTRRGRADRPRPTDRVFILFTHTKRSPRVASSHCLPTRDGPLREATTPDTPSTRARRRQSTTTTTTTMLAQRAQAFATGGATVASRARARATRGRTGRRAQTRAGIPIHIEYCEK